MTGEERIERFYRGVRARNRREVIAGMLLLVVFGYALFTSPLGSALFYAHLLLVLGLLAVMAVLVFIAPSRQKFEPDSPVDVELWRAEFLRQSGLLRLAVYWYILPLVPGIVMFLYGTRTISILTVLVVPAFFTGVALLNLQAATKLQREAHLLPLPPMRQ